MSTYSFKKMSLVEEFERSIKNKNQNVYYAINY